MKRMDIYRRRTNRPAMSQMDIDGGSDHENSDSGGRDGGIGGCHSGGFIEVPHQLKYNPPRKENFPPRTSNWRDGLNNILSMIESNEGVDSPIVLFKNEKYVCTYDMVRKECYDTSCALLYVQYSCHFFINSTPKQSTICY